MSKTTIQLTEEFQRKLKVAYVNRGFSSYEDYIVEIKELYDSIIPFKTEADFQEFVINNLTAFGFTKVIKINNHCPDLVLQDFDGVHYNVEIELYSKNFISHKHDPEDVDFIISAFSKENYISGVPVISILNYPEDVIKVLKRVTFDVPDNVNYVFDMIIKKYGHENNVSINKSKVLRAVMRGISGKKFTLPELLEWLSSKGVSIDSAQ